MFGKVGKGLHSYRVLNIAIIDVIMTIIGGYLIHKFIYVFSVPLIDFDEFMIRIKEMPHMIMQTRRALTNDDWDKSYVDTSVIVGHEKTFILNKEKPSKSEKKNILFRFG